MDIVKLQYEAACIANENALAVFKEAEADEVDRYLSRCNGSDRRYCTFKFATELVRD